MLTICRFLTMDAIFAAVESAFPDLSVILHRIFREERSDLLVVLMARIIGVLETDHALGAHIDYQNGSELLPGFLSYGAQKEDITVSLPEAIELCSYELWKIWRNNLLDRALARRRRSRFSGALFPPAVSPDGDPQNP